VRSAGGKEEALMADEEVYLVDGEETVITGDMHVRCDGGNGPLGHPIEFLTLEKGGQSVCKYCDRRFVHKSHPDCAEIRRKGQRFAA
jgi:uncharacterized Zn-finger protein